MFPTGAALGATSAMRVGALFWSAAALLAQSAAFAVAAARSTETLLTRPFGRGVQAPDRRVVRTIMREAASDDDLRSSTFLGIIKTKSYHFVQTRGA